MINTAEDEAPRPDPGFRIYVERGGTTTDVTHAVMDVYDIAIGSMDFGSGFLSTEEIDNLRTLGKAIGAEKFNYQTDKCLRCGHSYAAHRYPGGPCYTVTSPRTIPSVIAVNPPSECDCPGFMPDGTGFGYPQGLR